MNFLRRAWAEIDTSALIHNFHILKRCAGDAKLMAVVKADAYGHSARDIAPLLQQHGADAFAVSNLEEALVLRDCGITKPILILGYTPPASAAQIAHNHLIQTVFSPDYAAALSKQAVTDGVKVTVHIKLDTGMGRIGFDCRDESLCGLRDALAAARLPGFIFDGVFTHFAVADRTEQEEDGFTDAQYARFSSAVQRFEAEGLPPRIRHCCNSAACCLDPEKHMDFCRAGILLYGLTPSHTLTLPEDFQPVMTFKSVVSMVKTIKAGQTVSYGRTFTAPRDMTVATVTAGYADGYPRLLSGRGHVVIHGQDAPLIGRICMDQFCVDVSAVQSVQPGDEVTLFGKELPVEQLADLCGTINYEIVCGLTARVPRILK